MPISAGCSARTIHRHNLADHSLLLYHKATDVATVRDALTQRRWQATSLALRVSLLTALLLGVSWYRSVEDARSARVAQFGNAAAAQLAALSIEPLITLDRIRLGVLATRMSELPEIESVTIVTVDDRIVANAGTRPLADTPLFTHDIEFEGVVAGSVQIAIAGGCVLRHRVSRPPYLLLPALIVRAAVGRRRLSAGPAPRRTFRSSKRRSRRGRAAAAPPRPREWLLAVNLLNLMALPRQGARRRTGGGAPACDTSGSSARRNRERPLEHRRAADVPPTRDSGSVLQGAVRGVAARREPRQLQRGAAHRRAAGNEDSASAFTSRRAPSDAPLGRELRRGAGHGGTQRSRAGRFDRSEPRRVRAIVASRTFHRRRTDQSDPAHAERPPHTTAA